MSSEFDAQGFWIIPGVITPDIIADLQSDVEEVGRLVVGPDFTFANAQKMTPAQQSAVYDRLHYLPALARLSGSKHIRELCRSLGIQTPWLMGCCNMRMDRPSDYKHLFEWHQDTLYLLGSQNAVTLWIPLGRVDLHRGTIQVIPGSHKKGIYPFKQISNKPIRKDLPFLQRDLSVAADITEEPITIEANAGDIVAFKQMLLHRSTANRSDAIRWTVQLRITDLSESDHRKQNFPTGDKTNIFFVDYPGFRHPLSQVRQERAAI
jgi:hypothetical protein